MLAWSGTSTQRGSVPDPDPEPRGDVDFDAKDFGFRKGANSKLSNSRCQDTTAIRFGKSLVLFRMSDWPMHLESGSESPHLATLSRVTHDFFKLPASLPLQHDNLLPAARRPLPRNDCFPDSATNPPPHVWTMVAFRRSQAPWRHVQVGSAPRLTPVRSFAAALGVCSFPFREGRRQMSDIARG